MKIRRNHIPRDPQSKEARRWFWTKIGIAVGAVVLILGLGYCVLAAHASLNNSAAAKSSSAAAASSAKAAAKTAQKALIAQNNHHTQNVQAQADIEKAEAVIKYEGVVLVYVNSELLNADKEIIAAQQTGHATQAQLVDLQMELTSDVASISAALIKGQQQLNEAITFQNEQTCVIETHLGLSCASPPPLPTT